ncbi:hypothetical protein V5096_13990 [Pseudoalteromonas carrageenovora]|uniref:hypothetical protein n=1 Tax=Pseudoalteromonas carrageenovora TaxID=227 RepID=UPI002FD30A52
MQFTDYILDIKVISILVSLIIFIIGLPLLVSRVKETTIKHQVLSLDFYERLKSLVDDGFDKNFPTLLVAVYGYVKCELKQHELLWFVNTPGAFKLLKKYASCRRYLMICNNLKVIAFKPKYLRKRNRSLERLKLFILYFIFSLIGFITLAVCFHFYSWFGISAFFIGTLGLFCFVFAFFFLNMTTQIDRAEKLVKEELPSRDVFN